jgi:hypothetical protein
VYGQICAWLVGGAIAAQELANYSRCLLLFGRFVAGFGLWRCGQPVENGVRQGQSLNYGFVDRVAKPDWTGIPGSVGCRLSVEAPAI